MPSFSTATWVLPACLQPLGKVVRPAVVGIRCGVSPIGDGITKGDDGAGIGWRVDLDLAEHHPRFGCLGSLGLVLARTHDMTSSCKGKSGPRGSRKDCELIGDRDSQAALLTTPDARQPGLVFARQASTIPSFFSSHFNAVE
jgi:hypothetical protein